MSEATEGPWYTIGDGVVRVMNSYDHEMPLKLGSGWREDSWEGEEADAEVLANATLVAAAPDLLKAVEAFVMRWDSGDRADTDLVGNLMKKAYTKATAQPHTSPEQSA